MPLPHLHLQAPWNRRALYVLYALLGLAALWVAGALALFAFLQSDYLRAKLAATGSSKLGRELTIGGPLTIAWHWGGTVVEARDVALSNMPGLTEPNMLEIAQLRFTIKPLKLMFGRMELPQVTITQPRLVLERRADGSANWQFPALTSGQVAANAVLPSARGDFPIIGEFTVTDGAVIYRDAIKKLDVDLKLSTLSGGGGDKKDDFAVAGKGTISGKTFTVDARGGSLFSLRDSNRAYPLDADIVIGDTRVGVHGVFHDPIRMEGVDTRLTAQGPNLADLYYLTSIPLPPTPAYKLDGRLVKEGDVWRFDIPEAKVGNSDLAAKGSYDVGRTRGFLKAELSARNMHMDDLGGFIGLRPRGTETVAPRDRLFPDVPINLERLRRTDLDVHLVAQRLTAPGWPFQSMDVTFKLDNGLLRIDPIKAAVADGTMTGSMVLDGRRDVPHVESDLLLRRLSMKKFFGETRFAALTAGRFGGRFQLAGDGRSLAEVLSTADGRISVMMAGGQISLTIIEAAGLDIAQVAPLLLGQDKTTGVRCAIGDFTVKNGLLTSDVFDFDTQDTNLYGDAVIDLRRETIDAEMEAHPKDNSPLTARTPITITGPLRKPNIGIKAQGIAARGLGAAALALLNPLAAILPFVDMGGGEDTDCRALIRQVRARYHGDIPGPTASEAPPLVQKP